MFQTEVVTYFTTSRSHLQTNYMSFWSSKNFLSLMETSPIKGIIFLQVQANFSATRTTWGISIIYLNIYTLPCPCDSALLEGNSVGSFHTTYLPQFYAVGKWDFSPYGVLCIVHYCALFPISPTFLRSFPNLLCCKSFWKTPLYPDWLLPVLATQQPLSLTPLQSLPPVTGF